jgi:hypothetical protein
MIHRIELYLDNTDRVSFLREVDGDFNPAQGDPFVVIAREYDENRVTRTWFLSLHQFSDGISPFGAPPHRVVSAAIRPGEPTPPADPTRKSAGGFSQEVLAKIKQLAINEAEKLQRTERFCATYNEALQRAKVSQAEVDRLYEEMRARGIAHGEELKKRDDQIWELLNENQANRQQIAILQASYAALEDRKSLPERVKAWLGSTGRKLIATCAAAKRRLSGAARFLARNTYGRFNSR